MSRRSNSSMMERKSSGSYSRPTSASPISYRTSTPTRPQSASSAAAEASAATLPCNFRYVGCYLLIIISDGCDQLRQQSWLKHWIQNNYNMDQQQWKEFNENWFNGFTAKVIQQVNKGLSSWNYTGTEQDLKIFEDFLRNQATGKSDQSGSEANPKKLNENEAFDNNGNVNQGQILLQYAQQSLAVEVLCNPSLLILCQCLKNVLRSPTGSIQIIYSGATFLETGSWILADGIFSAYNFYELIAQAEQKSICSSSSDGTEQNPCKGHGSIAEHLSLHDIDLQLHTQPSGEWAALKEMSEMERGNGNHFLFRFKLNMEPRPDLITALAMQTQVTLLNHISDRLDCHYQWLLDGSQNGLASIINQYDPIDTVGFIRLEHPTLYVVPSGQGDCALLSLDGGFTMLWDGGYLPAQKSFWPFVKHLRRIDSVVATHLGEDNFFGLTNFLALKLIRKQLQTSLAEYPRIGYLFCNDHLIDTDYTDLEHNQSNPLVDDHIISLKELSKQFFQLLKQLNIDPLPCIGNIDTLNMDSKMGNNSRKPTSFVAGSGGQVKKDQSPTTPITLYHKVGVGTLYMYVLNPTVHRMISKTDHSMEHGGSGGGSGGRSTPQSTIHNDPKKEAGNRIPEADQQSICSLLIWRPHNPADRVLRILLPSNCTQAQILDGIQSLMIVSKFDQTLPATASATGSAGHVSRRLMPTRKQMGMATTSTIPQDFDDSKLIELLELDVLLHQNTVCNGEKIEKGLKDRYEKVIPGLMMGKTSSLHQYARSLSMAPTLIRSEKSRKLNSLNRRGKSVAAASGKHVERTERPETPSRYSRFRSVSPPNTKNIGTGQKIASVVSSIEKRLANKPSKMVQQQDKPTMASMGGDRKHLPPLPPKKTKTVPVSVTKTVAKVATGTMDGKQTIVKAAVDDGMRKTVMEQVRAINKRKADPLKPQTLQSKIEPVEVIAQTPPVQTGKEKIDDVIIENQDVIKSQPQRSETSDSNKEELSEETSIRSPTDEEVRGITRRIEQQEQQEAMIRAAAAALTIDDETDLEPRIGDAEWRPVKPGLGSKDSGKSPPLSVDIGKISSEIDYETDHDQLDSLNLNEFDRNGPIEIDQPVINKDVGVGDNESINQPELYVGQPEEKLEQDELGLQKTETEIDTSIHQAPVDLDEAKKVAEEATSAVNLAAIEKIEENRMKPQPASEAIPATVTETVEAEKPQAEDQMEPTIQIKDAAAAAVSVPVLKDAKIDEVEVKDKTSQTNRLQATPTSVPDGKTEVQKSETEIEKESAPAAMSQQIDGNEKIELEQVGTGPKLEIEEESKEIQPDSVPETQISIDKVEPISLDQVKTVEPAEELKSQVKPEVKDDENITEQPEFKQTIEESTLSVPEKEQIQGEKVETEQNKEEKQVAEPLEDMKPEPKDEETKLITKIEELKQESEEKAESKLEIEDSGPEIIPTIVDDKVVEDQTTEKTPTIVPKAISDNNLDENQVQSELDIKKSIPEMVDLMVETKEQKDDETLPESIPGKEENFQEKVETKLETVAEIPSISKVEQVDSEESQMKAQESETIDTVMMKQDDQVKVETQSEMTKTTPTLSLAEGIANVEGKKEPELEESLPKVAEKEPESKVEQELEVEMMPSSVVPIENDQKIDSVKEELDIGGQDEHLQDVDVEKDKQTDEETIVSTPEIKESKEITTEIAQIDDEKVPDVTENVVDGASVDIVESKPEIMESSLVPALGNENDKKVDADKVEPEAKFEESTAKTIVSDQDEIPVQPELAKTIASLDSTDEEKKIQANLTEPEVKTDGNIDQTISDGKIDVEQVESDTKTEAKTSVVVVDDNLDKIHVESELEIAAELPKEPVKGEEAEPEPGTASGDDQIDPEEQADQDLGSETVVDQVETNIKTPETPFATEKDEKIESKLETEAAISKAEPIDSEEVGKSSKTEEAPVKQEPETAKVDISEEVDEKVKAETQPESADTKTEDIQGESVPVETEITSEKDEEQIKTFVLGEKETKIEVEIEKAPKSEDKTEKSEREPDAQVVIPSMEDGKDEFKPESEKPTPTEAPVDEETKSESKIVASVDDQAKPDVETTKPTPETALPMDSDDKNDTVGEITPKPEVETIELLIEVEEKVETESKIQDEIVEKVKVEPEMETTQELRAVLQETGLETQEPELLIDSLAKDEKVNDDKIKLEPILEISKPTLVPDSTKELENKETVPLVVPAEDPEKQVEEQEAKLDIEQVKPSMEDDEITASVGGPKQVEIEKAVSEEKTELITTTSTAGKETEAEVETEFETEESAFQISSLIAEVIDQVIVEPELEETKLQVISSEKDEMIDGVEGKVASENENTLKTLVDSIEEKIDLEPKAAETLKTQEITAVPIGEDSDRNVVKPVLETVAKTFEEIKDSLPVVKDGKDDTKTEPDLETATIAMDIIDKSETVDEALIKTASIVAAAIVLSGENSTSSNLVPTTTTTTITDTGTVIQNLQQQCQNVLGQTNQLLEDMDQKIIQVTNRLTNVNSPEISSDSNPTIPSDIGEIETNLAIEETVNQTVVSLPAGTADIEFHLQTTVVDDGLFEAQQVIVSSMMQAFVESDLDAAGQGGDDDEIGSKDLMEPSSVSEKQDGSMKQTKELLEPESEHVGQQQQQPSEVMQSTYETSFDPLLDLDQRMIDVKDQTDDNNNCIESKQEQDQSEDGTTTTTTTVLTTAVQLITTIGVPIDVPVLLSGIQFQTLTTTTIQSITQPILTAQTGEQVPGTAQESSSLSPSDGGGGVQTEELIGSEFTSSERTQSSDMISSTTTTTTTTHTTANGSSSETNPTGNSDMDHGAIPSVIYTMTRTSRERKFDADKDWDPPMALPSPQPPPLGRESGYGMINRNRSLATNNSSNRNLMVQSSNDPVNPVYMDLVYVPGHGKNGYCDEQFFRKIRARYYVFSAVEPNRKVFDDLLNGIAQWKNNDWLDNSDSNSSKDGKQRSNKVTIVPTYESEALAQWSSDNRCRLEQLGVEVVSAANRCWISLNDDNDDDDDDQHHHHSNSTKDICFSYKIEF